MTIKMTEDQELKNEIKEKLSSNGGYCPCKLLHIPENKCMCKEFKDAIKNGEPVTCHCGLYSFI